MTAGRGDEPGSERPRASSPPESMRKVHTRLWGVVAVWAALAPSLAIAQSSLPANNGIKLGDARVHPYFDLELRYDSAAGFFPRGGVISGLQPEVLALFRPGLKLELPSDTVQLDL